jgi:uncharacterized protein (DUF58 family)
MRAEATSTPPLADPDLFLAIDDLDLSTRALVDSVLSGNHRGAKVGPGSEFAQHRDYRLGDDLRQINWRLYGRTRRLFVKEVFAEAKMPIHLLVDASASMRTGRPISKYRYAARVAAALALIGLRGRDPVGLRIARAVLVETLFARAVSTQFSDILAALEQWSPEESGDLAAALEEVAESCRQRGVVVVLSDFIECSDSLGTHLAALRDIGHEVAAVQILAPEEVELPEEGDFEFSDPETGRIIKTAVEPIRDRYAAEVRTWRESLRITCESLGVHLRSVTTNAALAPLLRELIVSLRD